MFDGYWKGFVVVEQAMIFGDGKAGEILGNFARPDFGVVRLKWKLWKLKGKPTADFVRGGAKPSKHQASSLEPGCQLSRLPARPLPQTTGLGVCPGSAPVTRGPSMKGEAHPFIPTAQDMVDGAW